MSFIHCGGVKGREACWAGVAWGKVALLPFERRITTRWLDRDRGAGVARRGVRD